MGRVKGHPLVVRHTEDVVCSWNIHVYKSHAHRETSFMIIISRDQNRVCVCV